MTKRVEFIEIDLIKCSNTYGVAPCTATGPSKCFNCRATCQDLPNIVESAETVRYSKPSTNIRFDLDAVPNITIPSVASIAYTAPELKLGESIGVRASLTVTFNDHRSPDTDASGDKYLDSRDYDPYTQGTYFGKLRARYPFLKGSTLRYVLGDADQLIADMETRTFVIEGATGPNSAGVYTITAKDILKLADGDRSQAPVAKAIQLTTAGISAAYTGNISVTTGTAATIPTSGFITISGVEVVSYEKYVPDGTNSTLTILARAQQNTAAVAHDQGADIQDELRYSGESSADILHDLVVNYANVDPSFVSLSDWQLEADTYINRAYGANIPRPTAVNVLINELLAQTASTMWWDNVAQKIRWEVLKNPGSAAAVYDETVTIKGSFNIADNYTARRSQVWVYYGQLNPLLNLDDFRNYANVTIRKEDQFDGYFGGLPAIEKIFSRWIPSVSLDTAERLGDLILQRYVLPPRKVGFKLMRDSGISEPQLGGVYAVSDTFIQDANGVKINLPVQLTGITPTSEGFVVRGEEVTYTQIVTVDPDVFNITLSTNENNVVLRDKFDAIATRDPLATDTINVVVTSGTIIGSTSTGAPALRAGSFPAGVTINLTNNGYIVGRGGDGGNGGSVKYVQDTLNSVNINQIVANPTAGGAGGSGMLVDFDINLTNNGVIGGGGGGGGGSQASTAVIYRELAAGADFFPTVVAGNGGSGGAGSISGGGGASGSREYSTVDYQIFTSWFRYRAPTARREAIGGLAGALTTGGDPVRSSYDATQFSGVPVIFTESSALAGTGGLLGTAGNNGAEMNTTTYQPGDTASVIVSTTAAGGAGGAAIVQTGGTANILETGDIRGAIL